VVPAWDATRAVRSITEPVRETWPRDRLAWYHSESVYALVALAAAVLSAALSLGLVGTWEPLGASRETTEILPRIASQAGSAVQPRGPRSQTCFPALDPYVPQARPPLPPPSTRPIAFTASIPAAAPEVLLTSSAARAPPGTILA
jgi:hypothetical protein